MRPPRGPRDALRALAHEHGIQLSYTAQDGRRVRATNDSLRATLHALGVEEGADGSVGAGGPARRPILPPVVVMGRDGLVSSGLALAGGTDPARCELAVTVEDGSVVRHRLADLLRDGADGTTLDLRGLGLPAGYHELAVSGPGVGATALLLAPPPPPLNRQRSFGVFAPVYGLRSDSDWGIGSFSDLGRLADYAGSLGAEVVGTLPMFAAFFNEPVDPSPYLPVSRLFTNEVFVDVDAVPELSASPEAKALAGSSALRAELASLRDLPKVDYGAVMARKRRVLEACASALVAGSGARREAFESFCASDPRLASYATFRAAAEKLGTSWRAWDAPAGSVPDGAADEAVRHYHRYVQFVAAEQLAAAAGRSAGLYLDLPVGVHPDGFDTWSHAELFAPATVGAPPDRLAPQGQAWGFPPLHPERIRADRYRYVIACYRHLLARARAIRIDHFLGLQRMFWIAAGATAETGAYVRYHSEELLAIVSIEAARAGAVVVGEDLGTVPAGIRRAMDRDGVLHMFVYQFDASASRPLPQPQTPSLAALGSHDLPRFAAFWRGTDIDDRVASGVTTEQDAEGERAGRRALVEAVEEPLAQPTTAASFGRCIDSLAAGPAPYVLVDLADIEGETIPDNRPGTGPEAANWRQRLDRSLPDIIDDPAVAEVLTSIAAARRRSAGVVPRHDTETAEHQGASA